jgi:centrosomal protein CEP164
MATATVAQDAPRDGHVQDGPKINVLNSEDLLNHAIDERELLEYAEFIGIDVEFDRDLFYIAREGLCAVPPEPWKACQAEGTEDVFYFNFDTGESVWDHPCDNIYREKVLEAMEERVLVPLTLQLDATEQGHVLKCTNLAGIEASRVDIGDLSTTFADVLPKLLANLKLHEGSVARFVLQSAELLGHSRFSDTVGDLLVPRSRI